MQIKLLHDLVAIREAQSETTSAGGIALIKAEKQYFGVVIAVGPGFHATSNGAFIPTRVKVGDIVLYNKKAGEMIDFGSESLLVMPEPSIIAILADDEDTASGGAEKTETE